MLEMLRLPLHPREVFVDVGRVYDEHVVLLRQSVDQQIINRPSIRETQLCVESLMNGDARDIVGDKILQKSQRLSSLNLELADVAHIKESRVCAYRLVSLQNTSVLYCHLPAAALYTACA